ncbi:MAG: hypothetical protein IPL78_35400 [Chloroflexi bacterium]|nr:hypothetical protein [Chloroflexota bacterium]
MTLFAPTTHPTPLPLFSPSLPPTLIRTPQQAIQNACHRWPALAERVRTRPRLLMTNVLFTHPATPHIVAWCWESHPPGRWRYHRLTPGYRFCLHLSGLAAGEPAGPGDGRYCPHILAWLFTGLPAPPLPVFPFSACGFRLRNVDLGRGDWLNRSLQIWLEGTGLPVASGTSTPLALTIRVTNWLAQDWLTERIYPRIQRALSEQAGYRMDVTFVVRYRAAGR